VTPARIGLARYQTGTEEVEAIASVLASGVLTNGPWTERFERDFARRHEVEHAVAVANGTLALLAIHLGLGVGPGDEVITPSMTFISTATSILHAGATPVFADVDPVTFTLDPHDVARRITPRTKAIVVVHYGGQAGDMRALRAIADDAGVLLIEDAAEAHGASYAGRPVGGLGDAAMFSFTPTKNITTGEGGMITTRDGELAARLRLLRNHGQTALYEHSVLGYNLRMTEMQAAMGCVQVGRLDGILERKRANAALMGSLLSGIDGVQPPAIAPERDHTYMLYTVLVAQGGAEVIAEMRRRGVEARLYFPPAHLQRVFRDQVVASLPVTEHLAAHMVSLPFHSLLTEPELHGIADTLAAAMAEAPEELGTLAPSTR
jgi:perosamine synthetase